MSPDLSFVIPCYKSTPALRELVCLLLLLSAQRGLSAEIILVHDSREPRTSELLSGLMNDFENVTLVQLSRNFGQHNATAAGIATTAGQIVVTLDDDLQHPAEAALEMVEELQRESQVDLVYGVPRKAKQKLLRFFFGTLLRALLKIAGLKYAESISPFRAFRGRFRDCFIGLPGPHVSVDVVLSWSVGEVKSVKVNFRDRSQGDSGYSGRKLVRLAIVYLLSFSTLPLRLALLIGVAGSAMTIVFAIAVVVQYLDGSITEPGFTTITLLLSLVGSLLLMVVGIIGEYVGLQHRRGMGQPLYFVLGQFGAVSR